MKTVVLGPRPAELGAVIARRRALGHDGYDEVWAGAYHVASMAHPWHGHVQFQLAAAIQPLASRAGLVSIGPFNLGEADDFRVPDGGVHRAVPDSVFVPSAMIVIEVVSPGDESWEKFDFFAARGDDEILPADPAERSIAMFLRSGSAYERVDRSELLGVTVEDLHASIAWPGPG